MHVMDDGYWYVVGCLCFVLCNATGQFVAGHMQDRFRFTASSCLSLHLTSKFLPYNHLTSDQQPNKMTYNQSRRPVEIPNGNYIVIWIAPDRPRRPTTGDDGHHMVGGVGGHGGGRYRQHHAHSKKGCLRAQGIGNLPDERDVQGLFWATCVRAPRTAPPPLPHHQPRTTKRPSPPWCGALVHVRRRRDAKKDLHVPLSPTPLATTLPLPFPLSSFGSLCICSAHAYDVSADRHGQSTAVGPTAGSRRFNTLPRLLQALPLLLLARSVGRTLSRRALP